MASSITIGLADPDDLPALAAINQSAYYRETIAQFAFKDWPDCKDSMLEFFKARLAERFSHARTQIFKATDASGRISGFISLSVEGAEKIRVTTPTATIMQQIPPYFNQDFVAEVAAELEQLKTLMEGQEHYYLSDFAVDPRVQGNGIGSLLLKHCLDIVDKNPSSLCTWLIAFPGSHSLYLLFGFKDVEYRDIDLDAWDRERLRGYGVYRQYAMARG